MPSPTGIFVGKTETELRELIDAANDRAINGDRTSLSGAGKSSGFTFSMSPETILREANFALQRLTGTAPPRRTHFNASGQNQGPNSGTQD